ncbi:MAG TPA: ATPase, T2SS/T4P/T4SS family [Candidatus Omnitrophota bacterium]|nr:ATPase, T2SS/T4P/T4SS family [Candidatus Omnitrophota bacterium]
MIRKKDYLVGELLIKKGYVSLAHIDECLKIQEKTRQYLGAILVHKGYIDELKLLEVLSDQLGIPYLNLRQCSIEEAAVKKVPAKLAFHYKALPVSLKKGKLTVLVADPLDNRLFDELPTLLGCEIEIAIGHENQILEGLDAHYGLGAETLDRMGGKGKSRAEIPSGQVAQVLDSKSSEDSVVKLVNQLLLDAQKSRATDIHFEPYEDELRIRYRIDGILQDANIPSAIKQYQANIISRIKVMANLDIAEKRLPQDGRIKIRSHGGEIDLRISVLPTTYGEAIVVRLLSPTQLLQIEKLGFEPENQKNLQHLLKNPYGIILLTGPTGSGKTTTLYACLAKLNDHKRKIITIEDPIEYQLKGVVQIQVHPKIGLSFSQGLRHVLRHDPDVIMVGEVRDQETAEITIRTALTGHLVFSTLHTNDAPGAIARLLDMGIEPYLVSSSVIAVIAQRLVRVICPKCKRPVKEKSPAFLEEIPPEFHLLPFWEGEGCEACKGTGFHGRTSIHELMMIDDELRDLIIKRVPSPEIRQLALNKGMKGLIEDGFEKAGGGITTAGEVLRVTRTEGGNE